MKYENGIHILNSEIPMLPVYQPGSSNSSIAPGANVAILYPFWVPAVFKTNKLAFYVAASSGNVDFGIYDKNGSKIISLGSTPSPAILRQEVSLVTTLNPVNNPHYIAFAANNGTFALRANKLAGYLDIKTFNFNSSFPLPASFNLASPSSRGTLMFNWLLENFNGPDLV